MFLFYFIILAYINTCQSYNYNFIFLQRPHIKFLFEIVTYVVSIVNGVIVYFDVPNFSHENILTNHIA